MKNIKNYDLTRFFYLIFFLSVQISFLISFADTNMTVSNNQKRYDIGVKIAYVGILSAFFSTFFVFVATFNLLGRVRSLRYDVEANAEAFAFKSDMIYEKIVDLRNRFGFDDNGRSYRSTDQLAEIMNKCNS